MVKTFPEVKSILLYEIVTIGVNSQIWLRDLRLFPKKTGEIYIFFFKFYFGVGGDQGKTILFKKTVLHLDYIFLCT